MKVFVLNGWAASADAWKLCPFIKKYNARIFSYLELLDGKAEEALAEAEEKVLLIGWSMGGSMSLKLINRYCEKIVGLVLVAATPRMMEEKETLWQGMSERRMNAFFRGAELMQGESLFGVPEGKPNPYISDNTDNLQRGIAFLRSTDVRSELLENKGKFNFPVFIFQSEKDGIVKKGNADWLKKEIFPHATMQIIEGNEHALSIMIPGEINEAVDSCIAIASKGENS